MQIMPIGFLDPYDLDTKIKSIASFDPEIIANIDFYSGHFEIQYGGHRERNLSGSISKNVWHMSKYMCAKFVACTVVSPYYDLPKCMEKKS